jgi:hypothetical protein
VPHAGDLVRLRERRKDADAVHAHDGERVRQVAADVVDLVTS